MVEMTGARLPSTDSEPQKQKERVTRRSFAGIVECPLFTENAKLTLDEDGLIILASFDQLSIPYGEITAIALTDYRVEIQTAGGMVSVSHLGQAAQWLYDKLYAAYNEAVLKALLVEGEHNFEAEGQYSAEENGQTRQGRAVIRLYADCLCLLPPGEGARRIPLCFLTAAEKDGFTLTLTLSTGERFTLSKLGQELDNLNRLLTAALRTLREQTLAWIRELAPNLSTMQATTAAKLMPLGTAASMEKLSTAAPLRSALEQKIAESRMAQTYPWLHNLCGGHGLMVGALPPPPENPEQPAMLPVAEATHTALSGEPEQAEEAEPKPILWMIAPDEERRVAAVELALADGEAAATYLYRVEGEWESFARQIDRALEAAGFQRELILLPDEKLHTPEHLAASMLVRRTPALTLLRSCFMGRAIHSSHDRWRRDIEKCRSAVPNVKLPKGTTQSVKFCTNCGAKLAPDAKFCGQCGFQF